jgi:hypothetical protein
VQILVGGETIKTGGLAVNDGGVVTKAPKGDLLAMYINATGGFTDASLTIDGKQVGPACSFNRQQRPTCEFSCWFPRIRPHPSTC